MLSQHRLVATPSFFLRFFALHLAANRCAYAMHMPASWILGSECEAKLLHAVLHGTDPHLVRPGKVDPVLSVGMLSGFPT